MRRTLAASVAVIAVALVWAADEGPVRFVIVGDRTGEAQTGVWEKIWQEVAAAKPAFVLSVGDVIQGQDDGKVESEWKQLLDGLAPYRKIPLYFTPGNHDVWSERSAAMYPKYTGRPLHYSFDSGPLHVTVLDTSRSDALPAAEMGFLEADLAAHAGAKLKFVVMHRPSWIMDAPLRNTQAPLHQLAKKYGVRWMIAGHVHQLIHTDLDGVTYFAAPSAGGHLRLSGKYEDGWFFGWTEVEARDAEAAFTVHELGGRSTTLAEWGLSGIK